ncbi:MAG: hypothetical protein IM600_18525 [Bacteroidetes bacterium]|nr:hypothetical protein [Bacteroidota bacterium]
MFGLPIGLDEEKTTKHGFDKLELMCRFIKVIEGEQCKEEYALFKLWIRSKLKRHLTAQEELNLAEGIYKYIKSDEGTNERLESMKYLFNTEFLSEPACV